MRTPKIILHSLIIFNITITIHAQTTFEWETATDNGNNITEIKDGITATFIGPTTDTAILFIGETEASSGNIVTSSSFDANTIAVTFSFSEPVNVYSISALEGNFQNIDYTFTPTGGSNPTVVAPLVSGIANLTLNWTNITSFTVTSPGAWYGFDNLVLNHPLSIVNQSLQNSIILQNPVIDFLSLTHIKGLKSTKIYNNIGQLIIETTANKIDFTQLKKGLYYTLITTENGVVTKKILKK